MRQGALKWSIMSRECKGKKVAGRKHKSEEWEGGLEMEDKVLKMPRMGRIGQE